ncbi:MAG TPA: TIGR03435 family protein [Bryobacteraceae bacterium]|nr:TIGR03435 family protein [Bryobacteraceae bacterium]
MGAPGFSGEVEHVGGHWFLFNASMPQLAKFASDYVLHKPVIDQTGLEGSFDYRDRDAKIRQDNGDFEGSFTVFIRDIGLKLTSAKGPVATFVIEHAEKPSPN